MRDAVPALAAAACARTVGGAEFGFFRPRNRPGDELCVQSIFIAGMGTLRASPEFPSAGDRRTDRDIGIGSCRMSMFRKIAIAGVTVAALAAAAATPAEARWGGGWHGGGWHGGGWRGGGWRGGGWGWGAGAFAGGLAFGAL